jgi:CBS domain-containing protein
VTVEEKYIVADVMSKVVVDVALETTARDAAEIMVENGVSSLLIKENGSAVGIVTDRDFTGASASGKKLSELKMKDLMTESIISVDPKVSLQEAIEIIRSNNIRHLLVKSNRGDYVGLISVKDLLSTLFEEIKEQNIKLKRKVNELEKFYKIAIDRELVMVKLKKRIHELEKRLGEESDLSQLLTE